MRLALNPADQLFRDRMRDFVVAHWRSPAASPSSPAAVDRWWSAVREQGFSVPGWPVEHGGTGWTDLQQYLWHRETALAGAPESDPIAVDGVGPLLCRVGSPRQRTRYLGPIRDAGERWCLGFAGGEPGTDPDEPWIRARPRPGGFVLDGDEPLVADASAARHMLCLARTADTTVVSRNLSLVIVDLRSPGVCVRPGTAMGAELQMDRVELRGVRVTADALVGAARQGWRLVEMMFDNGRAMARRAWSARCRTRLQAAVRRVAGDPAMTPRLNMLGVDLLAQETLEMRLLLDTALDESVRRNLARMLAVRGVGTAQRITELEIELFGYDALRAPDQRLIHNEPPPGPEDAMAAMRGYLAGRAWSIGGLFGIGPAVEIEKNRMADRIF